MQTKGSVQFKSTRKTEPTYIPRCAWCNAFKIDNEWVKDAPYVEGAYTHGICESCRSMFFPKMNIDFMQTS